MPATLTIKQLHENTGALVRKAGASPTPITITDHGVPVAVIAAARSVRSLPRSRRLLPEYVKLMKAKPGKDLQADLDAVRGDR